MTVGRKLLIIGCFGTVILLLLSGWNAGFWAADDRVDSLTPFGHRGWWDLIFSDSFDSQVVDPNKWLTCHQLGTAGCVTAGDPGVQQERPETVSITDGKLQLAVLREGNSSPAGSVTTDHDPLDAASPPRFAFKYGYVEVRARIPSGVGLSSSVRLLPENPTSHSEIGLMKVLGDRTDTVQMELGYPDPSGSEGRDAGQWTSNTDLSSDWHTYAVDWKPDVVAWYVDGIERRRITNPSQIPSQPMYLLLSLAEADNTQTGALQGVFETDYVRVWKRGGQVVLSPIADTYVDLTAKDHNFGSERQLNIDADPKQIAFLKYDLSPLRGKQIQSVWLRVKTTTDPYAGSINTQTVHIVSDNSWTENRLTYTDRLNINQEVIGFLAGSVPDTIYDIPLKAQAIQNHAGGTLSIAIQTASANGLYIYSRELNSIDPRLFVNLVEDQPGALIHLVGK